jgi:hypothetical protein
MSVSEIPIVSEFVERPSIRPETEISEGVGEIMIACGPGDREMMEHMLHFRAEFIQRMRWSTLNSHSTYEPVEELAWLQEPGHEEALKEADVYDAFERTMHFMMTDNINGEILAGLRLTPVTSVENSLSWSMFENRPIMRNKVYEHTEEDGGNTVARLNEAAARTNLYDLTRLVTPDMNDQVDPLKIARGMIELFAVSYGAIKRATPEEEWEDVRWVFTGTSSLVGALSHLGIEHRVLSSGKISKIDTDKSYFCLVNPEASMQHIIEQAASEDDAVAEKFKLPYEHMQIGFRKANAL